MVGGVVRLDRQEGASTDVKRHGIEPDAAIANLPKQQLREMEPRRRRRHRAVLARKKRLVVRTILLVCRAPRGDVGRQRHLAAFRDGLVEDRAVEGECQRHLATPAFFGDRRVELSEEADFSFLAEPNGVVGHKLPCGLDEGPPVRPVETPVQCRFDPRLGAGAADATAEQPRGDHSGVVDDQLISRLQQVREVSDCAVIEGRTRPDHQQPRCISRARRPQRDAVLRKLEIEQIATHGRGQ